MNKKLALIVFTFFDALALLIVWLGYSQINQVMIDISNSADTVSYINRTGIPFIGVAVPIFHLIVAFEYFYPGVLQKRASLMNRLTIIFGIVLFVVAISISISFNRYVENSGYQYCSGASGVSALFKTLVYTKDAEICRNVTTERRAALGLPPK